MSERNHIKKAISLPPGKIWREARHRLRRHLGRLRARMLGTEITDAEFLQSLSADFPDVRGLSVHLASEAESPFFLNPTHRPEVINTIREAYPEMEIRTIAAADQACDHVFDLLGAGPTHLGDPIDWHIDFKSGHRFNPQQYYADVRRAPYPGGYDIKVPWELSRCQHFVWLGQAYWFTDDEKYALAFVDQVSSWIEQNRPQFGVNWASTMDVAIRAVNWLWGYHFFQDSPRLDNEFRLTFFKSLLAHGRHIFRNLENQGDFTGNHYLANLVGLIYLGILCPEFKEAHRWRTFGLQELEREMFEQVYPDGVNFEASTSYHRLVTEMFLSTVILTQLNGIAFSTPFMDRLERMLEFVLTITRPDGTVPQIGDNDNGRLHRLKVWDPPEREWIDFRYLLAIGAVLFERKDFAQAAGDQWQEAIWLLGKPAAGLRQSTEDDHSPLHLRMHQFADAGICVVRHDDWHMTVSAGPVGQKGRGGHAHNDQLSFELYANDQAWIVDPGTYVYTSDYEARHLFRSTGYHNTPQVYCHSALEQHRCSSRRLFSMKQQSVSQIERTETDAYIQLLLALSNYAGLDLSLERKIQVRKQDGVGIVHDRLIGDATCGFSTHFHLADLPVDRAQDRPHRYLIGEDDKWLLLECLTPDGVRSSISSGWISPGYGTRHPAPVVTFQATPELAHTGMTVGFRCLESHPAARPQDAARFAALLEALKSNTIPEVG